MRGIEAMWKKLAVLSALSLGSGPLRAQQGDGTDVGYTVHVFKPAKVEATPSRIEQLKAPPGFRVTAVAKGLKNARIVAVAPDGTIYISRRDQGDVLMLKLNAAGEAAAPPVTVANRPGAHGLAIHEGKLFLATVKQVFVADILPDGRLGPLHMLIKDLADAGQHADRTLAFGPDGQLYVSVGSTCNACNEDNPENATLLRVTPDGKSRAIFATGLRNTIGFDWNPVTGELWGLDNGIDFLGDEAQPEELNKIEFGKQYGWPHVFGAGGINPQSTPAGNMTKAEWKAASTPMVLGYAAHAAPMQLAFYTGKSFPGEYQHDAFATFRGSWNRAKASGYEIARIHFVDGQPVSIDPFVTGFLTDGGRTHIARPVGLAVARDGSLLMADDANGVLYRVSYQGPAEAAGSPPSAIPSTPMVREANISNGVPLALERLASKSAVPIIVKSADFTSGQAMPLVVSEYADAVSPQLSWSAVTGAHTYAVIMEDPDAKPRAPFAHWMIWNILPPATSLPQGVQKQARLSEPDGVLQGRNARGSQGYYGPRPPIGDAPHHYHIQVFALDGVPLAPAGSDREALIEAMQGHVVAKGELVGTFQQASNPPLS